MLNYHDMWGLGEQIPYPLLYAVRMREVHRQCLIKIRYICIKWQSANIYVRYINFINVIIKFLLFTNIIHNIVFKLHIQAF